MKNIFVTGATGFLGKHLCKELAARGYHIFETGSKSCDLTNSKNLEKIPDIKFDLIFHLAAWTQAGNFCLTHAGEQWIRNQQINTNILTWWKNKNPQAKLITIGTSCSYDPTIPLIEDNYLLGQPTESLFTYAMTKRMLLIGARAISKQFNLNHICFVPSTLYGTGYRLEKQMHFIFDLIYKILNGKNNGSKVILWGDGYQKRELVLVDDFVKCMLKLIETDKYDLINIGAGEEHTIREFAQIICEIVDFDFNKIIFDKSQYVGSRSKFLINGRIDNLITYEKTSLIDGLKTTIDDISTFLKNQYEHKRII